MSVIDSILKDGLSAGLKLIPSPYLFGVGALALIGILVGAKIWFDNKVEAEAQKEINAYIVTQKKDDKELQAISTGVNTKIQIQYVDRIKVITKLVHDNADVIQKDVPDVKTILSDGWVSSYNSSVKGTTINSTQASNSTLSGINAIQVLEMDNTNYGICLQYKARADAWQDWYTKQSAAVAAQNKKDDK